MQPSAFLYLFSAEFARHVPILLRLFLDFLHFPNHFYQICTSVLPFMEHVKQQIKFAWWHWISSLFHGTLCDILFFFRYILQWHPTMWMNNPWERGPIKRAMHPPFVSIAIGLFAPPLSCAQQHKPVNGVAVRVWAAITDNPGAPAFQNDHHVLPAAWYGYRLWRRFDKLAARNCFVSKGCWKYAFWSEG